MYVCMYVCMHVCMHVYVCVHIYVHQLVDNGETSAQHSKVQLSKDVDYTSFPCISVTTGNSPVCSATVVKVFSMY